MIYYEKADSKVLMECFEFVNKNENVEDDINVFRVALNLSSRLIDSLIESQKEFDEEIKRELDKLKMLKEGPQQEAFMLAFNNKEITLVLDEKAHNALKLLNDIQNKNRKPL